MNRCQSMPVTLALLTGLSLVAGRRLLAAAGSSRYLTPDDRQGAAAIVMAARSSLQ